MRTQIELAVGLVAAVAALGVVSRWLRLPYPILLVVAGLVLSLHDGVPRFDLDPDLVLFGFLPPLLYAAAFNTEWPHFRRHLRAIVLLAVGLVLFTAAAVAAVAHHLIGLPWEVGFVLGAVVAPPDAVAAVAVTRRLKVPKAVATLLEGESLVNDASALVAYRVAVAAALGVGFGPTAVAADFALVPVGGAAIGVVGGAAVVALHRWLAATHLGDPKLNIVVTLLTPYAVYLPAEHLHTSGVLAVVACGLWVGSRWDQVFDPVLYIEARAVWETVEFLLNAVVFVLIGLQLPAVHERLGVEHPVGTLAGWAAAVAGAMVVARVVWVFPGAYLPRWLDRRIWGHGDPYPPWPNVAVVAWTGMRGVVSLAAALALPTAGPDGRPFPYRAEVQFLTFWAIFATLVGQGLTLPLVIRRLHVCRLADDDPGEEDSRA